MRKLIFAVFCCLLLQLTGCFFGRSGHRETADETAVPVLPPSATAEVSVRLRLHDESLRAALRAQSQASAVFSLKLINRGNMINPFILLRKRVDIVDGTAAVTFSAVPAMPVIASLDLEGAGITIGSTIYRNFHGGADLLPGQNNEVVIVASGSAEPEDVVARAALLATADFSTMTTISAAVFANLNEVFNLAGAADKLDAAKIFASYKNRVIEAKMTAAAGGTVHSLVLRDDGTLVAFGNNTHGQLAIPGLNESFFPKFSPFTRRVKAVAAGEDFSLLLCEDNKVYACGINDKIQLGGTGANSTAYPLEVPGLSNITAIAAGAAHALAIDANGQLYVWGLNDRGQLGLGTTSTSVVAAQAVSGLTGIKAIAAGNSFSLIIKADNSVWAAGDNRFCQLAADPADFSSVFVPIALPVDAISVAAGNFHGLALGDDGYVYAWGLNNFGQTGLATTTALMDIPGKITAVSPVNGVFAGANHSIITTAGGSTYVFGDNYFGQLALPLTTKTQPEPVLSAAFTSVSSAACGDNNTYAVSAAGEVRICGDNIAGQIGNGQTSESGVVTPVQVTITSPWN